MRHRWAALTSLALAIVGVAVFGHGAWIHAKARVAQVLLEDAWDQTRAGGSRVRPWSWADTWPVARLTAPGHDADLIVLAGASGAVMAFGPGHLDGTAAPGAAGNAVIAGHRDTHFAFLRDVSPGDEVLLETADGASHRYLVAGAQVVNAGDAGAVAPAEDEVLTLVTCFPFDTLVPGGPLRYVVRAVKETEPRAGISLPQL